LTRSRRSVSTEEVLVDLQAMVRFPATMVLQVEQGSPAIPVSRDSEGSQGLWHPGSQGLWLQPEVLLGLWLPFEEAHLAHPIFVGWPRQSAPDSDQPTQDADMTAARRETARATGAIAAGVVMITTVMEDIDTHTSLSIRGTVFPTIRIHM
jgi:hypothetical protein